MSASATEQEQWRTRELIGQACAPPLPCDCVHDDLRLSDLGVDSMRMMNLVFSIEEALGRPVFSIAEVSRVRTVGALLALV